MTLKQQTLFNLFINSMMSEELGRGIQSIYQFSYEEIIPLSKCKQLADQLLD